MISIQNKLKILVIATFGIYTYISSYPGSFTSSHSHAQQQGECKLSNDVKVTTWTGHCVNGFLEGDGEVVYESIYEGKKNVWKVIGKFEGGGITGLHFVFNITDSNGFLRFPREKISLYINQLKRNENILLKRWMDEQNQTVMISFEEAWAKAEAAAKKSNEKSMDPYLLKEYLAGRYKFNKADSQAGADSSDIADNLNSADDPQVFGGSSSPKAIKKKKK